MQYKIVIFLVMFFVLSNTTLAQRVIQLPVDPATVTPASNKKEKEYYSDKWEEKVLTNVTKPTLTMYKPDVADAKRTSVIIFPGGGYHALIIDNEGRDVAKRLNTLGITAFILKYRLLPTGEDGVGEFEDKKIKYKDNQSAFASEIQPYRSQAIADAQEAVKYVRNHASEFGIAPNRIGIMGFSVGGHLAALTGIEHTPESRPDFVVSAYLNLGQLKNLSAPKNAPPLFIACAADDAYACTAIYNKWLDAGNSVEIHLYSLGGHGFGMKTQNLPSDTWVQRFTEWLEQI